MALCKLIMDVLFFRQLTKLDRRMGCDLWQSAIRHDSTSLPHLRITLKTET